MVLRGQSPSTRLFPPDLLEFSIGRMGDGRTGHRRTRADAATESERTGWTHRPDAAGARDAPGRDGAPPRGWPLSALRRRARRPAAGDCSASQRRHAPARGRSGPAYPQGAQLHDVRLQRAVPRPADRGGARVGAHRRLPQPAAAARPRCTGTASGSTHRSDGVPGSLPAAGTARRRVHLSSPLSRRGDLLVPPARPRGHPAGARPLRQPAGAVRTPASCTVPPTARPC